VPYEEERGHRLILDTHDAAAFRPVAHLTVGGFRDWLLSYQATPEVLPHVTRAHPEMVAAVSN